MGNDLKFSEMATVDIIGDGWEFHGPAWLAWRIKNYAFALTGAVNTSQTAMRNAVQFHALGGTGTSLAANVLDDEWRCGNEPRHWPHPHWTDQLLELAQYADSLPQNSVLRKSALTLAQEFLRKAGKAD